MIIMYIFLLGLIVRRLEDSQDEMLSMSVCLRRLRKQ